MDDPEKGSLGSPEILRPGPVLRRAGAGDSECAYGIKRAAFKPQLEDAGVAWDEAEQLRMHDRRFTTQDYRFIDVDGKPVGIMGVVVAADCVRLNQFFLMPSEQGRGIGQDAMRQLLEEADGLGLPVRLQVMKSSPRAFSFYARLGFASVEETPTHYAMHRACPRRLSTEGVVT